MKKSEKLIKIALLSAFCVLNVADMLQTLTFLKMGIEGNPLVVYHPQLWFPLKFAFAFGLPLGLYHLDVYLKSRKSEGFLSHLRWFVRLVYISIFFADILYGLLVFRNMPVLSAFQPNSFKYILCLPSFPP